MPTVTEFIIIALAAQAHANELGYISNAQDSVHKLASKFQVLNSTDDSIHKLIDKLLAQLFSASLINRAGVNMDSTMLWRPGHLANLRRWRLPLQPQQVSYVIQLHGLHQTSALIATEPEAKTLQTETTFEAQQEPTVKNVLHADGMPVRGVAALKSGKAMTDVIHHTIQLDPFLVAIMDTPEYQRLRSIKQLGTCSFSFTCAVHDRFQHSVGVAHLAQLWARHFQMTQPRFNITDADVTCVATAGLIHDLGHGPFSHFWEHHFVPHFDRQFEHEELSLAIFDRLLEANGIEPSHYGLGSDDIDFIKGLVRGHGESRCPEKRFLYDIVANKNNGLDVDKLDYFERDSYFSGVVKISFDRHRLMTLARVADVDDKELQICFPDKAMNEVLQVFQTRFNLHMELYQNRVAASVALMVCDALLAADPHFRFVGKGGRLLRMSECGGPQDADLQGYLQLTDEVIELVQYEAKRAEKHNENATEGLQIAHDLLQRVKTRDLYQFVGSVVLKKREERQNTSTEDFDNIRKTLAELTGAALKPESFRVNLRRATFGHGNRNPLGKIAFFDNKGSGTGATDVLIRAALRPESGQNDAALPRAFQHVAMRVFLVDSSKSSLAIAKDALQELCDQRGLVFEGGRGNTNDL